MKPLSIAAIARLVLLWIACPLVAIASFRFLFGGVADTMPDFLYHSQLWPIAFYAHITLASLALALVPFQLWPGMRRRLRLHRLLGRIYALAILASGLGGLWLAVTTRSGLAASLGFGALAIAWIGTTAIGVYLAMKRDIAAHRSWMLRSTALTMAAVTLRIHLLLSVLAGFSYEEVVGWLAWSCWLPNLLVAEIIARRAIRRMPARRADVPAVAT